MANEFTVSDQDARLTEVEAERKQAIQESNKTYDGMIAGSDAGYDSQIQAAKDYAKEQEKIQSERTDLTVQEIGQQKKDAEKDYKKEQSAAWTDYQKESNRYGVSAEQMAASGLAGSGYSESSRVSMYNTYQNRVASAREAYQRAVVSYDNAMAEARLQNSAVLAEIAYQALQTELSLSLEKFQYKNTLLQAKLDSQFQWEQLYDSKWNDVLNQINTENVLAEEKRQFDLTSQEKTYTLPTGETVTGGLSQEQQEEIAGEIYWLWFDGQITKEEAMELMYAYDLVTEDEYRAAKGEE